MSNLKWKVLPIATLLLFNTAYAQSEKINLSVQNESLKIFIKQIESKTDYTFMLDQTIDQSQKVTVSSSEESLEAVLNKAFAGKQISYEIVGKQIILKFPRTAQSGQTKKVTGTIKDQNGEPVIGANIVVKGTTNGTITDIDGKFTLDVPANAILEISYIGFTTQELTVKGKNAFDIALSEDSQALDEVVVIGYGTQNRQAITGSIAKADLETYKIVPTNNVLETVKGSMPGLNVGGTSKVGEVAGFSVRGQNNARSDGNNPLVVIDGAIFNGSLGDIPSDDIESFTVLKDASAAAVYGSRSANGVVLIQTKRGRSKDGKPNFNVNLSYGISNELKRLEVYDAESYLQRLLDTREAKSLEADPEKIRNYLELIEQQNYDATPDHRPTQGNPYEMFRQNAYDLKANVSISNSSERSSYYISANMTNQKGVIMNDRYKNFSGRVNIDSRLTDWLKIGIKANYSIRDYSGSEPDMDRATQLSPYASIIDGNGNYLQYPQTITSYPSPFWSMHTNDVDKRNNLGAILDATITVPWVKGLSYQLLYSNNLRWSNRYYFDNEYTTKGIGKRGLGERKLNNDYNVVG